MLQTQQFMKAFGSSVYLLGGYNITAKAVGSFGLTTVVLLV